jgi:uncharacterized caspase-like protein
MSDQFDQGHALVIGIADYLHARKLPPTVAKDATDLATLLQSPSCGYLPGNVHVLTNGQATAANVRKGLNDLAKSVGEDGTAVVYFSGHGGQRLSGDDQGTYLIPYDCNPNDLKNTAIRSDELTTLLGAIPAPRLVGLLDACHSGGVAEVKDIDSAMEIKAGLDEKTFNGLAQGAGRVIMASSRPTEVSLILKDDNKSLFTRFLLAALKGQAPTYGDGTVRVFDVFHYVSDQVAKAAAQHPIFKASDLENNFPLTLYQGGKKGAAVPGPPTTRPKTLNGPTKLALIKDMVDRWPDVATYYDIPFADRAKFPRGDEPRALLDWLGQRKRLPTLRDAFNFLCFDDLIEIIDNP